MAPAGFIKLFAYLRITFAVAVDLGLPEPLSRIWHPEQVTIVPMPEAAVYQQHGPIFWERQVGLSRYVSWMKPVAESECVERTPKQHFGLCVLAADAGHHPAARLCIDDIRQQFRSLPVLSLPRRQAPMRL
jgi:hypothetical protein